MKKRSKKLLASYLLDEIGSIDDRFVSEAQTWRAEKRTSRRSPIRVLLVAASLVLVLAIGIGATLTALRRQDERPPTGDQITDQPSDISPVERLDSVLSTALQSPSFSPCSADELLFFDGNVRLAVKDRQTGEVYVSRTLNVYEQSGLSDALNTRGSAVASEAESGSYLVWVTLGDGRVISPCLSLSGGNVATATLFDYEAEYIPSQSFNALVESLS